MVETVLAGKYGLSHTGRAAVRPDERSLHKVWRDT